MPIGHELSEKQLDDLYQWVDSLSLSRPKKNINRDYSDGAMMAQTISQYLPKLVEIHNYPPGNSIKAKAQNWHTLNNKVLSKIGLDLSPAEIQKLAESSPMYIESLLHQFKKSVRSIGQDSRGDAIPERKDSFRRQDEHKDQVSKAQELREILDILKDKVTHLERSIARKDNQIKEIQEILDMEA